MWMHQLKLALRNLYRQRTHNLIQIFGFAMALTCVIMILSWVRYELSFDQFHENNDHLYRVLMDINVGSEGAFQLAVTPPPMAKAALDEFPEIVNSTRFELSPQIIFELDGEFNYANKGALADPEFLDMFSFPLIQGNPASAMLDPQSVLLSESFAKQYFDEKDPMNSILKVQNAQLIVTGIFKDIPANSHLQFDFLVPIQVKTLMGSDLTDWGNVNLCTYVQVAEHTDFAALNEKFKSWKTPREYDQFSLQPLNKIHSTSGIQAEESVVTDRKYVNLFIVLAFVILMIACINFVNLQSGQVLKRTKEVGIRKVTGANKFQLIIQFMSETCLVLLISYFISFLVIEITVPNFTQLFDYKINLQFYDTEFLVFLTSLFFFIVLITGLIPSIRFASFNPTGLMQKLPFKGKTGSLSRKVLVITQFVFSMFFIISTLVINNQFQFMKNRSLNDQNDQIIYLPFKGEIGRKYETFKSRLLALPSISHVTAKNSLPTEVADKTGEMEWPGKDPNLDFIIEGTGVDFQYFETLGIEVVEGRTFTEAFISDNKFAFVLNETAVKNMGLKNPVGADISLWGYPGKVVGIVEDVNLKSLRNEIDGQIFFIIPDYTDKDITFYGVILIKIQEDIPNTLAAIQDQWAKLNPGIPFDYHFLDEAVDSLYWDEMRLSKLMHFASILSVVICCLGLLGLVIHNSGARIKEIGIRKINGASMQNIMIMLNRDYILWVLISFVLAFPLAWMVLNKWLQNFAHRVELTWWIFIFSGLITILIALLTINGQIIKVAKRNPADILRYE